MTMLEDANEAVRPIRALLRGLEALEALNRRDGLTVSEVAGRTGLPRTTAYRILETLCVGGYAVRCEADDRYRPTLKVRSLADGFADDGWIAQEARPQLEELCRAILWPLMLATFSDGELRLRVATDRMSPFALERYAPGVALPLCGSSAGTMWLASQSADDASALLEVAARQGHERSVLADMRQAISIARERGYALDMRAVKGEADVAVPVRSSCGKARAVLSMRFIRSALSADRVADEFVPVLKSAAERVGARAPALAAANLNGRQVEMATS